MKQKVLFVCIHNTAGIEPGRLNPVVVEAMREIGVDISGHRTKSVREYLESPVRFDFVVTVCDETGAGRCPVFPGAARRLHWGSPDPSALPGMPEEKLAGTRPIRDAIKAKIAVWCRETHRAAH